MIEDNGAGISEANIGKLFKDYSRLEEHRNERQGNRARLVNLQNIIEQMGSGIEVESQVGKGTQFKITINAKAVDKNRQIAPASDREEDKLRLLEQL